MKRLSLACVSAAAALLLVTVMTGNTSWDRPGQSAAATLNPPPAPSGQRAGYIGCFRDSNNPFDLDGYLERSRANTPQRCMAICRDKGFEYAGVQYGESCLCGDRYGSQGRASNCDMPCTGDSKQICGGRLANSVYATGVGGDQVKRNHLGCYKDPNNPFDLDGYLERSKSNTPQRCVGICREKGFKYAGVQYGESCLCGDSYGKFGTADNCDMPCTGDRNQICGGRLANNVYATGRR
jgi:hypothetical protein